MFDPKNDLSIDVTQFWNSLGTVYNEMSVADKSTIETYWKALFNGLEGLYFDLLQSKFCNSFIMSPGYVNHSYDIYYICSGTTFSISGGYLMSLKPGFKFLSIPSLSGMLTNTVLYEGTDYDIYNCNYVQFPSVPIEDKYLVRDSISILPIMTNMYFPMMGLTNKPDLILNSGYYPSNIVVGGTTVLQQKQLWALHLWKLMQAIVNRLQRGGSMTNLTEALSLFYNTPFAYYSGIITDYTNYQVTISGEGPAIKYIIPSGLTLIKNLTDTVAPLELLCSGVTIHDYISNSGIVASTGVSGIFLYNTLAVHTPNVLTTLGYCPTSTEFFMNAVMPPNLTIKYY